jgi:IS30 family transposase
MPAHPLSVVEREHVSVRLAANPLVTFTRLGAELSRHRSTTATDGTNNGGRHDYQAVRAHDCAVEHQSRPKPRKLTAHTAMRAAAKDDLAHGHSPVAISTRLQFSDTRPDTEGATVSAETVYQALYQRGAQPHPSCGVCTPNTASAEL